MSTSKNRKQAANLRKALKDQGRTVQWLATEMGYNRSYVSNVLNGHLPYTEKFQRQATTAMQAKATVPVTYRGRVVHVPESIFRSAGELPLIAVESAYEEAWKRAWLVEHAQTTLAAAADRAWQAAQATGAA